MRYVIVAIGLLGCGTASADQLPELTSPATIGDKASLFGDRLDQSDYSLAVNRAVRAKEIVVETGWADDVFAEDFALPSLADTEAQFRA